MEQCVHSNESETKNLVFKVQLFKKVYTKLKIKMNTQLNLLSFVGFSQQCYVIKKKLYFYL